MEKVSFQPNSKNTHPAKNDRCKNLTALMLPTIFYVLKEFSDKEHPLTAKQIADYCGELCNDDIVSESTVAKKLPEIVGMINEEIDVDDEYGPEIRNAMSIIFSGTVKQIAKGQSVRKVRKDGSIKETKGRFTYYFEPNLTNSDLDMVCGAILSNRYFTSEEKDYLLFRERALGSFRMNNANDDYNFREMLNFDDTMPPRPKRNTKDSATNSNFLLIVNRLYRAITLGYQINMTYARYGQMDFSERDSKIKFTPEHKTYILNPYATIWNNGEFYLVASNADDEDQPRHFRVDRISALTFVRDEIADDSIDEITYKKRAAIPAALEKYFSKKTKYKNPQFNVALYTAEHPMMAIAPVDASYIEKVEIECNNRTLPLLVDTFGRNIVIRPSHIIHKGSEVIDEKYGWEYKYYIATIHNVHSECLKTYLLQNFTQFTLLTPQDLGQEILDKFKASLESKERIYS